MINEKFTRFHDVPTELARGIVQVLTDPKKFEELTDLEKDSVVPSLSYLDALNVTLKDEISKISKDEVPDLSGLKEELVEEINKLKSNEDSLDIESLWILPSIASFELRWSNPKNSNGFAINILESNSEDFSESTIIGTVHYPKSYFIIPKTSNVKYYRVQAFLNEKLGKPSPIVSTEFTEDELIDALSSMLRGKISETHLSRKLLEALNTNTSEAISGEVDRIIKLSESKINSARNELTSIIDNAKADVETELAPIRESIRRSGNSINEVRKELEGQVERVTTLAANVGENSAGIQRQERALTQQGQSLAERIDGMVAEYKDSKAEVLDKVKAVADESESKIDAVNAKTTKIAQSQAGLVEKLNVLTDKSNAQATKAEELEAEVQGNKASIGSLENTVAGIDTAMAKKLETLKATVNSEHFPNYQFTVDDNSWETSDVNSTVVKRKIETNDPSTGKIVFSGNGNDVKFNTKIPINPDKSYTLRAVVKSHVKGVKARLVLNTQNNQKEDLVNLQGGNKYPSSDEVTLVPGKWTILDLKVTGKTSAWPITSATEEQLIPLVARFGSPGLLFSSLKGSELEICELDLLDTSKADALGSSIDTLREATTDLTNKYESTATLATKINTKLDNKIADYDSVIKTHADKLKSEADKTDRLKASLDKNTADIEQTNRVIATERSSTAMRLDQLKSSFNRDLSNSIVNPEFKLNSEDVLEGWTSTPPGKLSVLEKRILSPRSIITTYPSSHYLCFWGNLLTIENKLKVSENDNIYASVCVQGNKSGVTYRVIVRFLDETGNMVRQEDIGSVSDTSVKKISKELTVPSGVSSAQLCIVSGNDSLTTRNSVYIVNPELRLNMAAVSANANIAKLEQAISSAEQAYTRKNEQLKASLDQVKSGVETDKIARAEKDKAIAGKIGEITAEFENTKASIREVATSLAEKDRSANEKIEEMKGSITNVSRDVTALGNDIREKITEAKSSITDIKRTLDTDSQSFAQRVTNLTADFRQDTTNRIRNLTQGNIQILSNIDSLREEDRSLSNKVRDISQEVVIAKASIQRVESAVGNANSAMSSMETRLTSDYIAKVRDSKSEVLSTVDNKLNTKVNQVRAEITSEVDAKLEAKANQVKAEITDNLSVGGTNLLRDSEFTLKPMYPFYEPAVTLTKVKSDTTNRIITKVEVRRNGYAVLETDPEFRTTNLNSDVKYTLSFYYRSNERINWIALRHTNDAGRTVSGNIYSASIQSNLEDKTIFQEFTDTFLLNKNYKNVFIQIGFHNKPVGTFVEFHSLKLEQGSISTDWSPAPEDLEGSVLSAVGEVFDNRENVNSRLGAFRTWVQGMNSRVETAEGAIQEANNTLDRKIVNRAEGIVNTVRDEMRVSINSVKGSLEGKIDATKSLVADVSGKLSGTATLQVNANGKITGLRAYNSGQSSDLVFSANNFKFDDGRTGYTPFVMDTNSRKIKFNGIVEFTNVNGATSYVDDARNYVLNKLDESQGILFNKIREGSANTITVSGSSDTMPDKNSYVEANGILLQSSLQRGITVSVINSSTLLLETSNTFDTYTRRGVDELDAYLRYLSRNLGDKILTLFSNGRHLLNSGVGTALNKLRDGFGDSFEDANTRSGNSARLAVIFQTVNNHNRLISSIMTGENGNNSSAVVTTIIKNGVITLPNEQELLSIQRVRSEANRAADSKDADIQSALNQANRAIRDSEANANKVKNELTPKVNEAKSRADRSINEVSRANDKIEEIRIGVAEEIDQTKSNLSNQINNVDTKANNLVTRVNSTIATLDSLKFQDTRYANEPPQYYRDTTRFPFGVINEFKQCTSIGISKPNWCTLQTTVRWNHPSGGGVQQIAICDDSDTLIRHSISELGWSSWDWPLRNSVKIDGSKLIAGTVSTDHLNFSPGPVNLFKNSQLMPKNHSDYFGTPPFWHDHAGYGAESPAEKDNNSVTNPRRGHNFRHLRALGAFSTWVAPNSWIPDVDYRVERVYTKDVPANTNATSHAHFLSQDVFLQKGQTYILSAYLADHGYRDGQPDKVRLVVEWLNANDDWEATYISSEGSQIHSGYDTFWEGYSNACRKYVKFTVPTSTPTRNSVFKFRIGFLLASGEIGPWGRNRRSELWVGRPMLELAKPGQEQPSMYAPSSAVMSAESLYVPNLSALSANLGSIRAGDLNINKKFIVSNNGVLEATGATITGNIYATGGAIRGTLLVGNDSSNGIRIEGANKRLVVVENGHEKVVLGKLS